MIETICVLVVLGLIFDRDRVSYFYHKVTGSSQDVKDHAIAQILKQMKATGVTLDELGTAARSQEASGASSGGNTMPRLFAILGGIFVLAGVGTYVGMFWDSMGAAGHVIVTLGLGIALTIFAITAIRENKYPRIVVPVLIAAAVFCTSGGFVLLHEMYPESNQPEKAMLVVFGAMALHQMFMYQFYPRTLTIALLIFYIYSALIAACNLWNMEFDTMSLLLGGSLMVISQGLAKTRFNGLTPLTLLIACLWFNAGLYDYLDEVTTQEWAAMITGISVFALGFGLSLEAETNLIGIFYFAGSIIFLAGLFDKVERTPYELIYLLASMGTVYLSIVLKSRSLLLVSTLSILFFIGYYADRYFVDSLSLPVALILAGFLFIGIGSGALKLKKKYF